MSKRALVSVYDKTGIVEFARGLTELGFELVSTGGTYRALSESGLDVLYISAVTEFPEILNGRVKTLHPRIHGGILAMNTQEHLQQCRDNGIDLIDLVCVNLYPFTETIASPDVTWAEAIENIDIGGPAMIRAGAKNHERVAVVVRPDMYDDVLGNLRGGGIDALMGKKLAGEAFAHTAAYDAAVAAYFQENIQESGVSWESGEFGESCESVKSVEFDAVPSFPQTLQITADKIQMLRYGENPIQQAAVYAERNAGVGLLVHGRQLQGKELSYNNWIDMDAAWGLVNEFTQCACAIIKHTNPCGLALNDDVFEAYERALACDPTSAYGGIISFNRSIDGATAGAIRERFYEVIIAPDFDDEALELLSEKKNLRLFSMKPNASEKMTAETTAEPSAVKRLPSFRFKSIGGGFLLQDEDLGSTSPKEWRVISALQPTQNDLEEMYFAWMACKHVKSNAIVVTRDCQILGVGAGQMNRVGSAALALEQAGMRSKGAYLASDAFFPFADTAELAAQYAIRAIVQPGGSVHDADVIDTVDKLGMIMVFTDRRHFRH